MEGKYIAVDFDGTCVTQEFPAVGQDIGAQEVLRRLVAHGHKLILCTIRGSLDHVESNTPGIMSIPGDHLAGAIEWFNENLIPLHGVNALPGQEKWTNSPKPYADFYIDDRALGTPLIYPEEDQAPYVDWFRMERILDDRGLFGPEWRS